MIALVLLTLAIGLISKYLWREYSEFRRKVDGVKDIKGPSSYFLIGNLDLVKYRNDLWGYFQKFQKLYPGTYRTCIGPYPVVVTDDYIIIDKVLQSKEMLDKPSFYKAINLPYGLIGSEYPVWSRHRKILDPAFHIKILEPFIPIFSEKSAELVKNLEERIDQPEFDMFEYTLAAAMNSILATTMDAKDKNVERFLVRNFKILTEMIGQRMFNIFLRPDFIYKLTSYYWKDKRLRRELYEVVDKVILSRKEMPVEATSINKPQILIDKLHQTVDQNGNCLLRTEEIREECYIMTAAGVETNGLTLASTILLLAMHQDVQDKLYKEVMAVHPKNEPYTLEILNNMTYMKMVFYENLRLMPTIPVVGRQALEDFDIGEGVLRRGMTIYMNIYSMHRNPDIWGADAHKFRPERFEPQEIEKRPVAAFTPFGRGQRTCIGRRYAMISLRIMLADLLKNYKFTTTMKSLDEIQLGLAISLKVLTKHSVQIERRTP